MVKRESLADIVAGGVAEAVRRQNWFDALPDEARAELLAVRERFQAGGYGQAKPKTVARVIVEHCQARGWRVVNPRDLGVWLQKS